MLSKELAHFILTSDYLDFDYALAAIGSTHKEFRAYCYRNDLPMPPLTEDLRLEVSTLTRQEIISKYYLSELEVNQLLYRDISMTSTRKLAQQMRASGRTEYEIGLECGRYAYDNARLAIELQERRDNGARVVDLAKEYGISHSTVSNLTNSSRPYVRLTPEEKEEIRASQESPTYLAKKYGVTLNTIYVTRRANVN